jgi:hypothetical protein
MTPLFLVVLSCAGGCLRFPGHEVLRDETDSYFQNLILNGNSSDGLI